MDRPEGSMVEAVARKSVDRVVIYTGALGSRDYVDDDINDDNFSDTYSSFEYGVNDSGCPIWEWPQGFIPLDSWVNDPVKVELIADTERLIDMSDKDYHELARLTDFRLDKSTIVRYLEANLWQPRFPNGQTAAERIMATIDWRCNFPLPAVNLALLSTELATGKNFVHGKSKDGRPVVYLLLGKENTWDPDGNTMALVYTLERAIRSMSPAVQETICIVDCDGLGMMNSPSTAFLSKIIDILGRHYPRRNGQIFICNVSSVFYFVWNAISVTLSDVAKKKIQILTNDMVEMRKAIVRPSEGVKDEIPYALEILRLYLVSSDFPSEHYSPPIYITHNCDPPLSLKSRGPYPKNVALINRTTWALKDYTSAGSSYTYLNTQYPEVNRNQIYQHSTCSLRLL